MTSSESEERSPPKKRTKQTSNGGDGNSRAKKARGRPRVETDDKNAVDRRRTQIRMAQRNYRQRKETTISSLKQHNSHLQSIISQMNQAFIRFHDSALKSGLLQLQPSLVQELKHVTETFATLEKSATTASSDVGVDDNGEMSVDQDDKSPTATSTSIATTQQPQNFSPIAAKSMDIGWGYIDTTAPSQEEYNNPPHSEAQNEPFSYLSNISASSYQTNQESSLVPARRSITVDDMLGQSRPVRTTSTQHLPFGLVELLSQEQAPFPGIRSNSQFFPVHVPPRIITPPIPRNPTPLEFTISSQKTIGLPRTSSYQEITFARRLIRASLESASSLLGNPAAPPAVIQKLFQLSLPYISVPDLRSRLSSILSRGIHEELDFWEAPFIHLGGAGTHYPRRDAQGNITPIKNGWTVQSIGPMTEKRTRAIIGDSNQTYELQIDRDILEGEWFDAHDVEGYLAEKKGLYIPHPQETFVEVALHNAGGEAETANSPESSNVPSSPKAMDVDPSIPRRGSSHESDSVSLSNGSSSADSYSTQSTTPQHNSNNGSFFSQANAANASFCFSGPFGNMASSDRGLQSSMFPKFPDLPSTPIIEAPLGLDLAPGFDTDYIHANTNVPSYNLQQVDTDMTQLGLDMIGGPPKKKKTAVIDISEFISELVVRGICLGRAPGFRREDVDEAYDRSLKIF